jgi:hypothetical protein
MRQENVTCKDKIKNLPISLRWQHAVDGCGENEILEVGQGDEILEGACWLYRDRVSLLGQNKTQCEPLDHCQVASTQQRCSSINVESCSPISDP